MLLTLPSAWFNLSTLNERHKLLYVGSRDHWQEELAIKGW